MDLRKHSSSDAPQPKGGYTQATELTEFDRVLFISGQIPINAEGDVPTKFSEQCHAVWDNLEAQLRAGEMEFKNIVKLTTFLSDRQYAEDNGAIRRDRLDDVEPSLTVIITEIYDSDWLLEIEAIAAA
jgi:enamine deaminase RidA (YjgF/YER057c/UK114 family)